MPKVPTYDDFQAQARPLPGVRQESIASPSLFDAGAQQQAQTGMALQRTGSGLTDVAVRMQERENADKLFQAETAIKNDYLQFEQTARERRGQSAWGLTQDTAKWWTEAAQKHADALDNDVQRKVFNQQVAKLQFASLDSMSRFESDQRRVSLEESAKASIAGSINLAAAAAASAPKSTTITGDDGSTQVKQSFDVSGMKIDIEKRIRTLAQINGWSAERRDFEMQKTLTDFHKQVIQNRLDVDPAGARAYFEANKAEIDGSQYDVIDKALKAGGLKETAQKTSDQLAAQGMTEADGLSYIRQHLTGEDQEAAATEWKTRWAEQNAAREHSQKTAADTAWGIYARSGRVSDIPANVMAQMDGRDLVAIRKTATAAAQDKMPKTDWNRYYNLRQQAFDNPSGFASYDLRRDFVALAPAQREQLIDLQTKARNGGIKDVATLESQLSNMHETLGWGSSDAQKKGMFDTAVQREVDAEEKAAGRKLSFDARQKIIDRMAIEGKVPGSGILWDSTERYYQAAGTEGASNFVPINPKNAGEFVSSIPKTELQEITKRLKAKLGKAPTDGLVVQAYKIWKGASNNE